MRTARISDYLESRSYWRFQLAAWGFLGCYMLIVNPYSWKFGPIALELGKLFACAILSHLIAKIAFARNWFKLDRRQLTVRGLSACVVGGLLAVAVFHPIAILVYETKGKLDAYWLLIDYAGIVAVLAMWSGFFSAFYYRDLSGKMELERVQILASAKELQLSTLRTQLNPHFLFNSFNLLRGLVQRDPEMARSSITHLAEMMKHTLSSASINTTDLRKEIDFVESYLSIEKLRYEERLRINYEFDHKIQDHKIPAMLLYTLVENAVKYGIGQDIAGVDVSISIWREGKTLRIRVTNSGKLATTSTSTGTGLANARARLTLLYGEDASLDVFEQENRVIAEATWPAI